MWGSRLRDWSLRGVANLEALVGYAGIAQQPVGVFGVGDEVAATGLLPVVEPSVVAVAGVAPAEECGGRDGIGGLVDEVHAAQRLTHE